MIFQRKPSEAKRSIRDHKVNVNIIYSIDLSQASHNNVQLTLISELKFPINMDSWEKKTQIENMIFNMVVNILKG